MLFFFKPGVSTMSTVSPQITDAVTQTNVKVVA